MNSMYTCECADGRTITGLSRWDLAELKKMSPLELAKVLTQLRDFSRYYEAAFFYPAQSLKTEAALLERRFSQARNLVIFSGAVAGIFTLLWLILVIIPFLRFSGLTMLMAVLTLISILVLIPLLFYFVAAQGNRTKRLPYIRSSLEQLRQQEEKEIYGTYVEYLIGGYLISPEYSLFSQAIELMIQALSSRRATNISGAVLLCKKKFGKSPVPRIITSLHAVSDSAAPRKTKTESAPQKLSLNQLENQGPDIQVLLQLSEYLHAAVKSYSANQRTASTGPDSISATLSNEEEALIAEFRHLQDDEKKRIRRVVHSFYTKKY